MTDPSTVDIILSGTRPFEEMPPELVVEATQRLMEEYNKEHEKASRIELRMRKMLGVLGKLHFMAQQDPAIRQAAGCVTMQEYEAKLGLSHSTFGLISQSYREFPQLMTPELVVELGTGKLRTANRAVQGKGYAPEQLVSVLESVRGASSSHSAKNRLEDGVIAGKGELHDESMVILGTAAEIRDIKEALEDPDYREYLGTKRPAGMIANALQEVGGQVVKK